MRKTSEILYVLCKNIYIVRFSVCYWTGKRYQFRFVTAVVQWFITQINQMQDAGQYLIREMTKFVGICVKWVRDYLKPDNVHKRYSTALASFETLLAVLHLSGGAPSRGTEIRSLCFRNTSNVNVLSFLRQRRQ